MDKGTAIHETMHALGFVHEHSRTDRDKAVTVLEINNINYDIDHKSIAFTPFDPFSVMLYHENEVLQRKEEYNLWKLKPNNQR